MTDQSALLLEQLVAEVQANPKYAAILPDYIKEIGRSELQKRHNLKEAVKETKSKLHQVTGVYFEGKHHYVSWLTLIKDARKTDDPDNLRHACKTILQHHTSTKERLSYLDGFYQTIFRLLPPFKTILDIACGLNPLTIPWMDLTPENEYYGWDVNTQMISFLAEAIQCFDVRGIVDTVDIFSVKNFPIVDMAFIFKTLPCLEQVQKGISVQLLDQIPARNLVISFPSRSIGGVNKGMEQHYIEMMQKWLVNGSWTAQYVQFPGEVVYVLHRE